MSRHIGEIRPEALARAESYALRAVTLLEDAYSYTTLGTVLAARGAQSDLAAIAGYYDRAYDAFERASILDSKNSVTWIAFLRHTLKILERLMEEVSPGGDDLQDRLAEDWLRIHDSVALALFASETTRDDLKGLLFRYRKMVKRENI